MSARDWDSAFIGLGVGIIGFSMFDDFAKAAVFCIGAVLVAQGVRS